jgi:hypothetical protein
MPSDSIPPLVSSLYPHNGSTTVSTTPDFTLRVADDGDPAVGLNASSVTVQVKVKPSGGAFGEPVSVVSGGVVDSLTGWENYSFAWAGDSTDKQVFQGNPLEATLELTRNTPFANLDEVHIAVSAADTNGNVVGSVGEYQFRYTIEPTKQFGADTSITPSQTPLQVALSTPFSTVVVENLRLELLKRLITPATQEGNWQARSARRLVQLLNRVGHESLLRVTWLATPEDSEGPVYGATPLTGVVASPGELDAKSRELSRTLEALFYSVEALPTALLEQATREATSAGPWATFVESSLLLAIACAVRNSYGSLLP